MPKRKKRNQRNKKIVRRKPWRVALVGALLYFIVYNIIVFIIDGQLDVLTGLAGTIVFFVIYYLIQFHIIKKKS